MSAVECTHCRVLMTSWSAPGSPVRYWQCPFCSRTFSSLYGEVFERGAGARRVDGPAPTGAPDGARAVPQASREEILLAQLRLRAARWHQRLEQEGRAPAPAPAAKPAPAVAVAAARGRRS